MVPRVIPAFEMAKTEIVCHTYDARDDEQLDEHAQTDLESLNLKAVRTYIQSGNVVFESTSKVASSIAKKIATRIKQQHGFQPHVLLLRKEELLNAILVNPFPNAVSRPATLHFFFLEKY